MTVARVRAELVGLLRDPGVTLDARALRVV